ncbi:MAG TPA: hypothetical protein PKA42_02285 [Candidatus Paceibacterota bacterium]|nr:hypothetical protein [Candidatus Paceibacterota bacterium]HMO82972.1 hypothetical protein [Candidatus Paceibacterota bacterium]
MEQNTQEVKKPLYKKKWFWIGGFILLVIIGTASSDPQSSTSTQSSENTRTNNSTIEQEEIINIQATDLIADYRANEIAADSTYKGKTVQVTGVVGSIAKDILNNPYVTLKNESGSTFESVQCFFSRADEASLANVSKDTRITLQGRVSGWSLSSVVIRDCSILN